MASIVVVNKEEILMTAFGNSRFHSASCLGLKILPVPKPW